MSAVKHSLQDDFLNSVRKSKSFVTIFLTNGVKLQGCIVSFDNYCLQLRRDGQSQLVYKHAISTIMPSRPVSMYGVDEDEEIGES
ncbi:MAG: RNA chaperone Hfq [Albidovulum sp.]|nr:RNA chaperone Hfq [Albidovulum sp.]MDE0532339.1 RNA chaperone Hfq [Albidovulum sp.]